MSMNTAVAGKLQAGMASRVTQVRSRGLSKMDRLATKTTVEPIAPPEAEPLADPDPVLVLAAEIVRERGLCQGPWRGRGPLCAAGAVGEAAKELGLTRPEMESCLRQFAVVLGGAVFRDVHRWNDADGRTADEVAEALVRAAYGV
jgi:hypothetical protein